MSFDDQSNVSLDLYTTVQDILGKLERLDGTDRSSKATKLAAAIVEFSAFETALRGQSMDAARLIQIASELERLGEQRPQAPRDFQLRAVTGTDR